MLRYTTYTFILNTTTISLRFLIVEHRETDGIVPLATSSDIKTDISPKKKDLDFFLNLK